MQREQIIEEDFYKNSLEYKKMEDPSQKKTHLFHNQTSTDSSCEEFEYIENLTLSDMVKKLDLYEIRPDSDSTSRLFK